MSSSEKKPKQTRKHPRPSASIVLISPLNEVLMVRRVETSRSFASACVFPGGNLSSFHEDFSKLGEDSANHTDSLEYRLAAIRETFEESGILLARGKDSDALLDVDLAVRQEGREVVHDNKMKFTDWLSGIGGVAATESLIPFTRWVTPKQIPVRFSTQMYLFLLALNPAGASVAAAAKASLSSSAHHTPSADGVETTQAIFAPAQTWISMQQRQEIQLFPPQLFLLSLIAERFSQSKSQGKDLLQEQRDSLLHLLRTPPKDGGAPWTEKVITPSFESTATGDEEFLRGRVVVNISKPKGDTERILLMSWMPKGTPSDGEMILRNDPRLREEKSKL